MKCCLIFTVVGAAGESLGPRRSPRGDGVVQVGPERGAQPKRRGGTSFSDLLKEAEGAILHAQLLPSAVAPSPQGLGACQDVSLTSALRSSGTPECVTS